MSPIIQNNWADLLSKDPPLPADVQFRVTEVHFDGNTMKRTEVLGAHKFVLSIVSDIFKALFDAQIREGMVEIPIFGTTIEAFREFLKLIYSLFSDGKKCSIKAENWIEILNLCKKYKVEDAILLIEDRISSSNKGEGCIEEEFLTDRSSEKDIEKVKIKTEEYCILCQTFGHIVSEDCVSNAVCLVCGVKGHVRKDCKKEICDLKNIKLDGLKTEGHKCEEEYVEMDIKEYGPNIEVKDATESTEIVEREIIQDDPKNKLARIVSLKECSVNLTTVNIKTFSSAPSRSRISSEGTVTRYIKLIKKGNVYSCKKCDYVSKFKGNIVRHMKLVTCPTKHEVVKKGNVYSCKKCDYVSKFRANIVRHMKEVTYPCTQCDYEASRQDHLQLRVKATHKGVKYPCSQCDYRATQVSSLKAHIKAVHEGVKYPCTQCDYEATRLSHLKRHIKSVHDGVRYPCTQCDYKATQRGSLNLHVKAVHEGVKYPCSQCDYRATQVSKLKLHVKAVHEGV